MDIMRCSCKWHTFVFFIVSLLFCQHIPDILVFQSFQLCVFTSIPAFQHPYYNTINCPKGGVLQNVRSRKYQDAQLHLDAFCSMQTRAVEVSQQLLRQRQMTPHQQ